MLSALVCEVDPALDLVDRGLPRLRGVLAQLTCISFAASQDFCSPSTMAVMLDNVAEEVRSVVALLERWQAQQEL